MNIKPIDDASQLIYVSSAHEKYSQMFKEFEKHPYKFVEYYTGEKLSLWRRIYIDLIGRIKKSDYEKQQDMINRIIIEYTIKERNIKL